MEIVQVVDYS